MRSLRKLFAALALLAPLSLQAQPAVTGGFAFSENRGPNAAIPSGHLLVIGAGSITPSGAGTTVSATHVPSGSGPDFALTFFPAPLFPNQYAAVAPYAGQTGQWDIAATDAAGTTILRTHALDDVRVLPLITGLTVSGSALAPHLSWDAVSSAAFPSGCSSSGCPLGADFFSYQVEVREIAGPGSAPQVFASARMPIASSAPLFDIPSGILSPGNDYLIGIRFVQDELEAFLPGGGVFAPLENRSTAYVTHTAPIPEPETYAMLLAGLALLGYVARRRRAALRAAG